MAASVIILSLALAYLLLIFTVADGLVSFGYKGLNGPANWGNLRPEYRTCSTGSKQSPINIDEDHVVISTKLHVLERHYVDASASLVNNRYNLMVKFNEGASYITQDGNNYTLKQLHWHAPSEHTMNHKKFPLELHLVHKSEDGSISVAAILYDFGKPDPFISQLKDVVTRLGADRLAELPVDRVKMKALKRRTRWLFEYMGSLTTPPCSENVTWHVFGKVRKVTYDQVALIRSPLTHEFQHNSRPTQPLNGRAVELYDQRKHNHHSKRWSHGG